MYIDKFWYIGDKGVRKGGTLNAEQRKTYKRMNPMKDNDQLYYLSIDCDEVAVNHAGKKIAQEFGDDIPQIWVVGTDNPEKVAIAQSGSLLIPLTGCKNLSGDSVDGRVFINVVRKISWVCGGDLLHAGRAFKNPEYIAHELVHCDDTPIDWSVLVNKVFSDAASIEHFEMDFRRLRSNVFLEKLRELVSSLQSGDRVENVEAKVSNYKSNIIWCVELDELLSLIEELGYSTNIIYSRKSVLEEAQRVAGEVISELRGHGDDIGDDKVVELVKARMRYNKAVIVRDDWHKQFDALVVEAVRRAKISSAVVFGLKSGERLSHTGKRNVPATKTVPRQALTFEQDLHENIDEALAFADSLLDDLDDRIEHIVL
jgi:hypothetical protein